MGNAHHRSNYRGIHHYGEGCHAKRKSSIQEGSPFHPSLNLNLKRTDTLNQAIRINLLIRLTP
jgi:hypothetical protein